MCAASATVHWQVWQVCVVSPSRVEQPSCATEFNTTQKSPVSCEVSSLWLPELHMQPMCEHWPAASSMCGRPLEITVYPGSFLTICPQVPHLSLVRQAVS